MEINDDFFDLPDEGSQNNLLNSSLFSKSKKPATKVASFDNILASLPKSTLPKKSAVTFQDSIISESNPLPLQSVTTQSNQSQNLLTTKKKALDALPNLAIKSQSPTPNLSSDKLNITQMNAGSTSTLLDSLFPTSKLSTSNGGTNFSETSNSFSRRRGLQDTNDDESLTQRTNFKMTTQPSTSEKKSYETVISSKERELEELRGTISNMRYEKAEDQKIILDLRNKLEITNFEQQQNINKIRDLHKNEMSDQQRRHNDEIEYLKGNSTKNLEILNTVKTQEGSLSNVETNIRSLNGELSEIREKISKIGSREEDVEKILKFAKHQIEQNIEQFDNEKAEWKKNSDNHTQQIELEITKLAKNYEDEIVQGRKWIENERRRLHASKIAFQEEQSTIVGLIEQKRNELDAFKSEFLSKEHDLLIRVVNEKAILEQQRQDFQRQRNNDVARLRREAEHLEKCLLQVDNARSALNKARRDYEIKNQQLNEIKEMLIEYEKSRRKK